ncbi:MAG TPA: hypothetical protein VEA61_12785 [Allosphingosinicella sp.]|nr:hypothetical protein [Allosphingosinicella sp.]
MRAWTALVALAAATSPASATTGATLGTFGGWELGSNPSELPPAGRPMPPMRYTASFGDGWNPRWGAVSRLTFGPEGTLVVTFGGGCILRERIAGDRGRSRDAAVLMAVLLRQARYVGSCARKAGERDAFERRLRASMPDLRLMLKHLGEVSAPPEGRRSAASLREERLALLRTIASGCGLPASSLSLTGIDQVSVGRLPASASVESVECLLRTFDRRGMPFKLGFTGSEAPDPGKTR